MMKNLTRITFWIGVILLLWGLLFGWPYIFSLHFDFGPLITELPLEERRLKLIEYQWYKIDVIYIPLLIGAILVAGRGPSED